MRTIPKSALLAASLLCFCVSCMPAFEENIATGCEPTGEAGPLQLTTEPPAELQQAPRVLRLVVRDDRESVAEPLDPDSFVLIAGSISDSQLEQLQQLEPSQALSQRFVPSIAWARSPDEVVIAPTVALEPGEGYVLANGALKMAQPIEISDYDPLPMLHLVWPPAGRSHSGGEAVWCGASKLSNVAQRAELAPSRQAGFILNGITRSDPGRRCVHFELDNGGEAGTEGALPPPVLSDVSGTELARIEPHPLRSGAALTDPLAAAACELGEVSFGPGCAKVQDDRISVCSPAGAALWSVVSNGPGGAAEQLVTSDNSSSFLLSGFLPQSQVSMALTVLDGSARSMSATLAAQMAAPMPHVVLNEVLANPLGPEPAQEWVELFNDGLAPANLEGYTLVDVGGLTPLPSAVLPSGGYALLVNEDFDDSGEYDTPPSSVSLLLRVSKLGKGGLNNSGEPLKLLTSDELVVSRFPATPKPKTGRSVFRKSPKTLVDQTDGFVLSEPGASTPGFSNVAKD